MSSPPKPWSNGNVCGHNFRSTGPEESYAAIEHEFQDLTERLLEKAAALKIGKGAGEHSSNSIIGNPAFLQSSSVHLPSGGIVRGQFASSPAPPPIPPRPDQVGSYRYGVRGYPSYSSYSNPLYSGLYRSYGGIGYGSRMPYGSNMYGAVNSDNDLIRFAEESTRPAFQSIESVVQAVGSVSMMLESTFHALYSSYQAVLGVADQFTRLRNHLAHILSTLAVLRSLQWLCLKILYILGIRRQNPSNESAWSAATELASGTLSVPSGASDPNRSSWPIFIFVSVVLGAPWIILRLLSKAAEVKKKEVHLWASGNDQSNASTTAVVVYDFAAQYPQELSVHAGQKIIVAPKHLQPKTKGWILVSADGKKVGLIPSSYVKGTSSSKPIKGGPLPKLVVRSSSPQTSAVPEEEVEDKKQPAPSSDASTLENNSMT